MMKAVKKLKIKSLRISPILIVLGLGLIVRILLGWFGTLRLDYGTFTAWSRILADGGFKSFYNGWSDYLPGYLYVLWFLGKIRGVIPDVLLYKLPAMLADLATSWLIYKIVLKLKNNRWALISAVLYIFNPAILANSTFWGQIDSLTALFSLLAVYLLPLNYPLSAVSLAVGTLIKPQAALMLPVVLAQMFKLKRKATDFLVYGGTGLAMFVLGFVPFGQGNLVYFIVSRLGISANQYPYSSVNAFNFWGFWGMWQPDNLSFPLIISGIVVVFLIFAIYLIKFRQKKGWEYFLAATIFLAGFFFLTRMHERHLLPALAPLIVSVSLLPELLFAYCGLSLVYLANLYYAHQWVSYDFKTVFSPDVIKILILTNLALFSFILWRFLSRKKINLPKMKLGKGNVIDFPAVKLPSQRTKIYLILILGFALLTRTAWLSSPKNEYFDEVYHAFTARIILHNDPKAWEWWNPHPEGFAYEWTHPPLAKLGMVLGMKIFGENSFGWRIPGALLGVGSVFLVFLIARSLFKDELMGLLSAAVFSLDGLPLVMSRIGMNDSYLLFFALLTIYFFIRKKNFWSALAFGLAISSKWSAIWIIPVLFVLWLKRSNKFEPGLFWFCLLPFIVYLLTYLPMFLTGHNFEIFWGMQQQMWWYHTGLKATHPYTSAWWSWPLAIRPIYLYTSDEVSGWVSRIYAMGNPAVFWGGLAAMIYGFYRAFVERNKTLALVIFSYLVFFVPWAASPRIMFLYHYLPSIPFLAIATGYLLRRTPKLIFGYLLICLLVFIYFYSHWAGLKIPLWLDTSYYWFSSWR